MTSCSQDQSGRKQTDMHEVRVRRRSVAQGQDQVPRVCRYIRGSYRVAPSHRKTGSRRGDRLANIAAESQKADTMNLSTHQRKANRTRKAVILVIILHLRVGEKEGHSDQSANDHGASSAPEIFALAHKTGQNR